jgi:hypothetical protein
MRVARQLRRRHKILVAEAKRCVTMVEAEVGKVKAEMEKKVGQLKALIEKVHTVKKNYQKLLVYSWIFCAISLFLFGYTYKGTHNGKVCCVPLP